MIRFGTLAFAASLSLLVLAGCSPRNDSSAGPGAAGKANSSPAKLVLGFVPSQEADKLADTAKPMADFLSKELGVPVSAFTATSYVGLIEAMDSKQADIGSLPPLAYVLAKDRGAAELLLKTSRKGSLTYHSMFVARADSGIKSIEAARGKRMAFVEPTSTSGYLFPAAYLKKKGFDPDHFFSDVAYAGGHDQAIIEVYNRGADVAAVYDDARNVVEKTIPDVKTRVVKIGQTSEIPNDTISVRPGLDPELVKKIKAAFLKYASSPEGKKNLMDLYEIDGLAEAKDSDYDVVRDTAKLMDISLSSLEKK